MLNLATYYQGIFGFYLCPEHTTATSSLGQLHVIQVPLKCPLLRVTPSDPPLQYKVATLPP